MALEDRTVELELSPLAELAPFGSFHPGPAAPTPEPARFERFHRALERALELPLAAGAPIVLGPAVDPLRCRALPGERELRAFRAPTAGVLRLKPGVWFCRGEAEPGELDVRDYREIFRLSFRIERAEPTPDRSAGS